MNISSDLLLCLCDQLDQATYVHLFLSNRRCAKLFTTEPFLRVFFRGYRLEGLSEEDLQRGFFNLIKYPSRTYIGREEHDNIYYRAQGRAFIDIFDRIAMLEEGNMHHTNYKIKVDTLLNYRDGNVFLTRDDHLIHIDGDGKVYIDIPDVSACLVCNNNILLYRQGDQWYIYNWVRAHLKLNYFLPAASIRWIHVSIINSNSCEENRTVRDYRVHLVLDNEGTLIDHGLVVAHSLKRVWAHGRDTYVYLTHAGELYLSQKNEVTLVTANGTNYLVYFSIYDPTFYYLSGSTLIMQSYRRESPLATDVTILRPIEVDNHDIAWYSLVQRSISVETESTYLSALLKEKESYIAQMEIKDFAVDTFHCYLMLVFPPLI
jgi:hypothetical protein